MVIFPMVIDRSILFSTARAAKGETDWLRSESTLGLESVESGDAVNQAGSIAAS
jgi:hypothetical protein